MPNTLTLNFSRNPESPTVCFNKRDEGIPDNLGDTYVIESQIGS